MRRQLGQRHPFQTCEQIEPAEKTCVTERMIERRLRGAFGGGAACADFPV
jgi:hypothetical protein